MTTDTRDDSGHFPVVLHTGAVRGEARYIQSLADFVRSRPAQPVSAFLQHSNAVAAHDIDGIDRITPPTLITCGRRDALTSTRFAEPMKAQIRNAELLVFENGSHAPLYEMSRRSTSRRCGSCNVSRAPASHALAARFSSLSQRRAATRTKERLRSAGPSNPTVRKELEGTADYLLRCDLTRPARTCDRPTRGRSALTQASRLKPRVLASQPAAATRRAGSNSRKCGSTPSLFFSRRLCAGARQDAVLAKPVRSFPSSVGFTRNRASFPADQGAVICRRFALQTTVA